MEFPNYKPARHDTEEVGLVPPTPGSKSVIGKKIRMWIIQLPIGKVPDVTFITMISYIMYIWLPVWTSQGTEQKNCPPHYCYNFVTSSQSASPERIYDERGDYEEEHVTGEIPGLTNTSTPTHREDGEI